MASKETPSRNIRLNDEDWASFRRLLGVAWLRGQIARAVKREQRQPAGKQSDET